VTQIRVWLVSKLAPRHIKARQGSFALQHRLLAIYHFREYGSLVAQMIGFEFRPNLLHSDERKLNVLFWCRSNHGR
jgi:hypothetical protein